MLDSDLCLYFANGNKIDPLHASSKYSQINSSVEHCTCTWIRLTPVDGHQEEDHFSELQKVAMYTYNKGESCGFAQLFEAVYSDDSVGNPFNVTKQRVSCCAERTRESEVEGEGDTDCPRGGP